MILGSESTLFILPHRVLSAIFSYQHTSVHVYHVSGCFCAEVLPCVLLKLQ